MEETYQSNILCIRIEKKLREDFTALCKRKQVSRSLAVRRFVKHFIETGGEIPLEFDLMSRNGADRQGQFDDLRFVVGSEDRETFKKMCQGKCSSLIRGYMAYCVQRQSFPEWIENYGDLKKSQYVIAFDRPDGTQGIFSGTYIKKGKKYVCFAGAENKARIYNSETMAKNAAAAWSSCTNVAGLTCRVVKIEELS